MEICAFLFSGIHEDSRGGSELIIWKIGVGVGSGPLQNNSLACALLAVLTESTYVHADQSITSYGIESY